jgi:hypothetical protein|tara:strand:+ start:2462 stop:3382 length:921 start_codon:yes stop_codon:yes gene_type:complete
MEFLEVKKIWDKSPHNAFTDLIKFGEYWYCTFREADEHMSMDGKLRVIRSLNGKKWSSVALLGFDGGDVRDGKFSITPKNELMLNAGVRLVESIDGLNTRSVTWLSDDGKNWSEVFTCPTGLGTWRWSTTWHKKTAYSIGYTGKDKLGCLYSTKDGKKWKIVKDKLFPTKNSSWSESSLVFLENGDLYVLLRRDSQSYTSVLGFSKFPYEEWSWSDLNVPIGGPKMIYVEKQDKFLATVRLYGNQSARTSLCWIDYENGELREALTLPSGGDTSYAGMVYEEDILWISYYSSHEGKTSIYLAKVRI